jgi:hypothetical protein
MRLRYRVLVVATLGLASAGARAAAADGQLPVAATRQDGSHADAGLEWYGAPMIATDAAGAGLLFGSVVALDLHHPRVAAPLAVGGLGLYLLGGPIVHLAQGRTEVGAASLGVRVGLPVAGAAGGFLTFAVAASRCSGDGCQLTWAAVGGTFGLLGGMLAAVAVDDVLLARKQGEPKRLAMWLTPIGQRGLALAGAW